MSYEKGISNLLSTFNANKKPLIIAGEGELREYVLCNKLDNIKYVGLKSKESILSLITIDLSFISEQLT